MDIQSPAKWPRRYKQFLLVGIDTAVIITAVWAAMALRLGEWWPPLLHEAQWLFPLSIAVSVAIFIRMGFYRAIVRYAGTRALVTIVKGVTISVLIVMAVWFIAGGHTVPRSYWPSFWIVATTAVGGSRVLLRAYLLNHYDGFDRGERVVIYGAGHAGIQLATALHHTPEFLPVAFVDDNRDIHGQDIFGYPVYAPADLPSLLERHRVATILLAIPSAPHKRRKEILESLSGLPVHIKVMPSLAEIADGSKRIDEIREVDVEDILGRDPIQPDPLLLAACLRGKTVMVTGAGGSIGSELCRQILHQDPKRLVLFERSEFSLYSIDQELRGINEHLGRQIPIVPLLGSVLDRDKLEQVMRTFGVETLYHAAAYKHVPMVEHNPVEGVRNNVFGTLHTAQAAMAAGVETFVLISTDKAVRPTNVMGATKRFAELILQALSEEKSATRFCMVRFGNVLASSGSVVPLFRKQIKQGGPVTVTHPDIVRYFMTIPEAAQLVLQASSMGQGGDVFVLDMGEPVRIYDLARKMIRLSGFSVNDQSNPSGDIEIRFTGLRPGEKLFEELLISPSDERTRHPMIMRANEEHLDWLIFETYLDNLRDACNALEPGHLRAILQAAVSGYKPKSKLQDWVWLERNQDGNNLEPIPALATDGSNSKTTISLSPPNRLPGSGVAFSGSAA